MTRLRRSVLWLTPSLAAEWPPSDPDAIPDAVILDGPHATDRALLEQLRSEGVDCIVDDTRGARIDAPELEGCSIYVHPSRLARLQPASRLLERLRARELEFLVQSAPDVLGLRRAIEVAGGRVLSVIVDPVAEDLRAGDTPDVDPLTFVREEALIAAMMAGAIPVGCFTPRGRSRCIASDEGADSVAPRYSFLTGFRGALCRTWSETAAANRGYVLDDAAVARARELMDEVAVAVGGGVGLVSTESVLVGLSLMQAVESVIAMADGVSRRQLRARPEAGRA